MITFRNENENSAGNFNSVTINWVKLYFSYETCVAIDLRESYEWNYCYVRQNDWGNTTWKHLNWVDWWDKKWRVDSEFFDKVYQEALKQIWFLNS